jgi:hypothetical protein
MTSFGGFGVPSSPAAPESSVIKSSTPWTAASDGNLELLQESLVKLNLQPLAVVDENGYTLLHAAAAYNQIHILEWLLTTCNESVDPNVQDSDGDTPLHHVENIEAAKFLIDRLMADPNILNKDSLTPLQVRQEELQEQMEDDEEDEALKELVEYLKTVTQQQS